MAKKKRQDEAQTVYLIELWYGLWTITRHPGVLPAVPGDCWLKMVIVYLYKFLELKLVHRLYQPVHKMYILYSISNFCLSPHFHFTCILRRFATHHTESPSNISFSCSLCHYPIKRTVFSFHFFYFNSFWHWFLFPNN